MLLHALQNDGYECGILSYRELWKGAVERRFPAHQINGRWHFRPDDVPSIAAAYGLPRRRPPKAAARTENTVAAT